MHEQAFRFGQARHLVGVVGLPAVIDHGVGVIFLNAGMVYRVGPFRLHVELARRLNALGYPTLRFDLSTIGDSGASGQRLSRPDQVVADVRDAMELLKQQSGCGRFVLFGLCSGAQNAHAAAHADPRVAGALFLDGYGHRTLGQRVRHYLPRLFSPTVWRHRLTRRHAEAPATPRANEPAFVVEPLPPAIVREQLTDMLTRGLKLDFVYSGGVARYFNDIRQFRECFGRLADHPGISASHFKETDHTYVLSGDRQKLLDHVEQWMGRHFPLTRPGT
ncbi:alpha/beta fold hydrolase [Dyella sp. C11]|uniref:alpha/beta fold hydrolase n=1 Tax=Dyella sp. C11 TaxID=2126991 RepID=UPI000D64A2DD|nr:alpha/beta fold hydrolase [Dyella sp. C11]